MARAALRSGRRVLASAIGVAVAWVQPLEPAFVRAGRAWSRRSRVAGTVYALAQDTLVARLSHRGRPRYREIHIRGIEIWADITDAPARYAYFYSGGRERGVADAVMTALAADDVCICAGAHAPFFAIIAARSVGRGGHVIVFEPRADARTALAFAVDRNDVEGVVEIVPAALASLDDWLAARADLEPRVRCVKIDVPGGEAKIVEGMGRVLASPRMTIVCTTNVGSQADAALSRAGFVRHPLERGAYAYGAFVYVRTQQRSD